MKDASDRHRSPGRPASLAAEPVLPSPADATPHSAPRLPAFSCFGIELEYMIVDRETLDVLPMADQLLRTPDERQRNDVERGALGWSNELVMHVLEIKNRLPSASVEGLVQPFHAEVRYLNRLLDLYGARLMPTAAHPWMDPRNETRIWKHGHADLYAAYARIFDCRTHGWANLQSMHLNLPFADEEQFVRLHAAIRLALPILPALAASSPIVEGSDTGFADFRMESYRGNAGAFHTIAGEVVPESTTGFDDYRERILAPMYREIAAHDPEGLLQEEWLNSRGAIARFDRHAIEIRVIDTQECPQADLAIAAATVALTRALYDANADPARLAAQMEADTGMLASILGDCIRHGEDARIAHGDYLALLAYPGRACTAAELWRHLLQQASARGALPDLWRQPLQTIVTQGPLARRILRAAGPHPSRRTLKAVYCELCRCLNEGKQFEPAG